MGSWRHFRALKRQTVKNRLNIIIGLVIIILLVGLGNFWFGMRVMSGIRAYVGGEGLWSKAQKQAVTHLVKYAHQHDETDYQKFVTHTQVQLGDKQARLELDKPKFDYQVVREGFIQGRNHSDDVKDLIFLYRNFRNVSYMKSAINTWTQGDQEIQNLLSQGDQIHTLVTSSPATTPHAQATRDAQLSDLLEEVYATDARLTVLENRFSATLSEGARGITGQLLRMTVIITFVLGLLSLTVAIMIARALIRLDQLKSEFVSLASHQLRTPLTAMNWSSESLLARDSENLTPLQQKYIRGVYTGGRRLSSLIDNLLRVSSLDLNKYELDATDVDLRTVVDTVLKDQQELISEKNLVLDVAIDPATPTLRLDKQLLAMVIQNLISNSVKYTNPGGRITISAVAKKDHLLITVSDTGIGIPAAQQSQVFSKIFRADNAKKNNSDDGTGLGLYIAKAMIKRLGGTISFDSIENKGTNFYIKLPTKRRRHAS
jgi:hypothetical protein